MGLRTLKRLKKRPRRRTPDDVSQTRRKGAISALMPYTHGPLCSTHLLVTGAGVLPDKNLSYLSQRWSN
jgi:hypothetical protein